MRRNGKFRALRFEKLDDRCLLAGGMYMGSYPDIPESLAANVQITNLLVEQGEFLPGSSGIVERFLISTASKKHVFAQISANNTQFVFAPVFGEGFSPNINNFTLRIDGDGNMSNGCEMIVGSASPSWESGLVIIVATQNMWFCNTPRMAELTADFNTYLSGKYIASDLAGVFGLRNLGGKEISPDIIEYVGASPTIHTMLYHTYNISQIQGKEFSSTNTNDYWSKLVEFSGWGNGSLLTSMEIAVTNPGNLKPGSLTLVADTNWDGLVNMYFPAVWHGNTAVFDLGKGVGGYTDFWIEGYTAMQAMEDNTFQISLTPNVTAKDAVTGDPLKGVIVNGSGSGQIQQYTARPTTFALVEEPALVILAGDTSQNLVLPVHVDPGTEIVVTSFEVKNTSSTDCYLDEIALKAEKGDVRNAQEYVLYELNDDGIRMMTDIGFFVDYGEGNGMEVQFYTNEVISAGAIVQYEIVAKFDTASYYPQMLQANIDPFNTAETPVGSGERFGIKRIFYLLGENPWYTFYDDFGELG